MQVGIERLVDRIGHRDFEQRVAVRRGAPDQRGRDVAIGADAVLDDEGLAEPLRQPLPHEPRHDVGRATGAEADDEAHRTRRIFVGKRNARGHRERGSGCTLQEAAADDGHACLSVTDVVT